MDREAEELVNRGDARFIVAMGAAAVKMRMKQVPARFTRKGFSCKCRSGARSLGNFGSRWTVAPAAWG